MGRLIVSAQVTVDGVMDQLGDWFDPEDESAQHGREQLRAADALVLGRETYEFLSEFWPPAEGPYAELINPIPKYVASRTLRPVSPSSISVASAKSICAVGRLARVFPSRRRSDAGSCEGTA